MKRKFFSAALAVILSFQAAAASPPGEPVKIIFDTDIGNDVDDVLALAVLHALQARGQCELIGVTVTKPDELAGPFVDALNTFYGCPGIPIGCIRPVAAEPASKFLPLVNVKDGGRLRYPHKLKRGSDASEPTRLLRKLLSGQPDHSVVLVQVGYFSNFGALLDTAADASSPLGGRELVRQKVKFLSVMAGAFQAAGQARHFLEFNVTKDIAAARKVAAEWSTPMVWSGAEIGVAVPYPAVSIERDFNYVAHHPAAEAYYLYKPPPHERPTWDLTAALYAVLPDGGYFDLSPAGRVTVEADGFTRFTPEAGGRDRFLILKENQIARVKEALVQLASQPPIR
jgi:inosine-uridine nucleoside N-ribohydrolase